MLENTIRINKTPTFKAVLVPDKDIKNGIGKNTLSNGKVLFTKENGNQFRYTNPDDHKGTPFENIKDQLVFISDETPPPSLYPMAKSVLAPEQEIPPGRLLAAERSLIHKLTEEFPHINIKQIGNDEIVKK